MQYRWAFVTASRDARRNLGPLILILCIMAAGVSGVVALHGFKHALIEQMNQQSKVLFGADISVRLRGRFGEEHERFLQRIPGDRTRQLQFSSMAFFPTSGKTRLVMVSAIGRGYPLYGTLVTQPPNAVRTFYATKQVLIEATLAAQFDIGLGDTLRLGVQEFEIGGIVTQIPGAVDLQGAVAPRVFISLPRVEETKLLRRGSRVRSVEYFKVSEGRDVEAILAPLKERAAQLYLRVETKETKKHQFKNIVSNVTNFSQLVALIAVVLGAVGAASMAHVYISRRQRDIGILRCVGASRNSLLLLFFIQVFTAGLLGVFLGAVIGIGLESLLPIVFKDFIPLELKPSTFLSVAFFRDLLLRGGVLHNRLLRSVLLGAFIGLSSLAAFTLVPLLRIGRVSPMSILRIDPESANYRVVEKILFLVCAVGVTLFSSYLVTRSYKLSLIFTLLLLIVTLLLFLLAEVGIRFIARFRSMPGPFALRQGIANISRPQNQTRVLLVVLGLGSFLVLSVSLLQDITIARIGLMNTENQPNTLVFDVQADQVLGVQEEIVNNSLKIVDTVPLVTMRLRSVKGVLAASMLKDPNRKQAKWPLTRMYRSTYREALESTETLISGKVVARVDSATSVVPVTLEERIANELEVTLGDHLSFDVQGILMEVEVVGIRKVDWQQVKPNFFIVFPSGVFEDAPQTFVITARAEDTKTAVAFQRALVDKFSNVSIIDIRLIQESVQSIVDRLSAAARFLGLFCVFVAIVMLIGTVVSTREQRVKEFQILKFHGATKRTIMLISCVEFGLLSMVAVSFGLLFAYVATLLFSLRLFDQAVVTVERGTLYLALGLVIGGLFLSIMASIGTYQRSASELLH